MAITTQITPRTSALTLSPTRRATTDAPTRYLPAREPTITFDAVSSIPFYNTTDGAGHVEAELEYTAFGEIAASVNDDDPTLAFVAQKGYQRDPDTGLYYVRLRWYDATTKQFLSQDPLGLAGGDANLYRYADNNPLNKIDPNGTDFVSVRYGTAWWTVEQNGWFVNTNVAKYDIGIVKGATVHLIQRFGGGTLSLSEVRKAASTFWSKSGYGDISGKSQKEQIETLKQLFVRMRRGEELKSETGDISYFSLESLKVGGEVAGGTIRSAANSAADWLETMSLNIAGSKYAPFLIRTPALFTGATGFGAEVLRMVGGIGGGLVDLPGTVEGAVTTPFREFQAYREQGIGWWNAGVLASPVGGFGKGVEEAITGRSLGAFDAGRQLDWIERGQRAAFAVSAAAGTGALAGQSHLNLPRRQDLE